MMVLTLLSFFGLLQDPSDELAAPPESVRVEIALEALNVGGVRSFRIHGTSNLPDGTFLRARVFAVTEYSIGGEKMLDEDPMVLDDGEHQPFVDVTPQGGAVEVSLYAFRRPLYSLLYRGRLFYNPDEQSEEIRAKVGERKFSVAADMRLGTDEDFTAEIAATVKDLDEELRRLSVRFGELQAKFEEVRRATPSDVEGWTKWKEGWLGSIDEVRRRNADRYDLWSVWVERTSKLRIEEFCEMFDELAGDCTAFLEGEESALERAQGSMQWFGVRLEEAQESIGVDTPIRPEEVIRILKDYEVPVARLELLAGTERAPEGWDQERGTLDVQAKQTLLSLVQHLPRRGHLRVRDLYERFRNLLQVCSDRFSDSVDSGTVLERVREHRAALDDFHRYAERR